MAIVSALLHEPEIFIIDQADGGAGRAASEDGKGYLERAFALRYYSSAFDAPA
ncbi:MAG TPA: hypothetical protein VN873_08385 [Candidatus Angelobacter sp.]|nr:hypothetical protein [Candidatus Angelobacter sp.]